MAVASRAPAFGMSVAHSTTEPIDPSRHQGPAPLPPMEAMPLDRLLATSDVVSLHVPLTPATRHLIDRAALARMKRSAYLVNTSRGPVVDEEALAWALGERLIAGAALDVYEREPAVHHALTGLENVRAGAAPRERHDRDSDRHGRPRGVERAGGARRPASAHPGPCAMSVAPPGPDRSRIGRILRRLRTAIGGMGLPAVEKVAGDSGADPFLVLISTLLSARTQDATTEAASDRLFAAADDPASMARLPVRRIERLIYPVSFYRNKARHVKATAAILLERFGGAVPATMAELVSLPGVGRKTANLVLILAHRSPDQHLRRHARAPDLQPPRLGAHPHTGADRAGPLPRRPETLVARRQPVPRDLGPERLPADRTAVRRRARSAICVPGQASRLPGWPPPATSPSSG